MIEIRNVAHRFEQHNAKRPALSVLDGVSMPVEDGTFVSFLGPSGCGKTTLLRIIAGLVQPTSGTLLIDGREIGGPSAERAMVFQEFNLLPWRTALKNVEFGLELQGFDRATRRRLATETLELVGLAGFANYYPHELSGGMKQRIGLARALCTKPRYLLMDEPFAALDPQIRELMQIELMKLLEADQNTAAADRKTVVFVTHSIEEAIFLSDKIVVFSARPGRVLETLDIQFPRPRWTHEQEIKAGSTFVEYRQYIWRLLKQELQGQREAVAS